MNRMNLLWLLGEESGEGQIDYIEIDMYTLTYLKQIIKNNILHHTGKSVQIRSVQNICNNLNGKKSEKEFIYVYLNHFAGHLKLTQHC